MLVLGEFSNELLHRPLVARLIDSAIEIDKIVNVDVMSGLMEVSTEQDKVRRETYQWQKDDFNFRIDGLLDLPHHPIVHPSVLNIVINHQVM